MVSRRLGSDLDVALDKALSPYLFILVMQVLSALLNEGVAKKHISPFKCKDFTFFSCTVC